MSDDTKRLRSYSSPLNLGHRHLEHLFDGQVTVQEKIDGSQFSFGIMDGELVCRSRRVQIEMEAPGMFSRAVEVVKSLHEHHLLIEGWTYRGEYLQKPKHNTMPYDRVPNGHIILFDIDAGYEDYVSVTILTSTARSLDLEVVPTWVIDKAPEISQVKAWCGEVSILGGPREGVVFKNYSQLGVDHKTLMGKYVTESFRESHESDWRKQNPGRVDILTYLTETYRSEARWQKAIQHMQERGDLQQAPQDIGPLIREIQKDVTDECADEIKNILFNHYWKDLSRKITAGFPEWYKNKLMEDALDG